MAPCGWPHHQSAPAGWLWEDGDPIWDAQQGSAGAGLQPDVHGGQDSWASSNNLLLAAALVPGHPGPWTGGNSVHHHHLHAEVMMGHLWLRCRHLVNGCVDCSESVLLGGGAWCVCGLQHVWPQSEERRCPAASAAVIVASWYWSLKRGKG